MPMTPAQIETLARQDDQTLAEWWRELNCWRWPEGLPDPEKPDAFCDGKDVRWSAMRYIEGRVGKKLISRTWNKDMPDDVFESFWRNERAPGTPYGDFREKRIAARTATMEARASRIIASEIVLEDILDAEYIEDQ